MTSGLRRQIDEAAAHVEAMTRVLAGSDPPEPCDADRSLADTAGRTTSDPLPGALAEAIESVEAACAHLATTAVRQREAADR